MSWRASPSGTVDRDRSEDAGALITRRLPISTDAPAIAREALAHLSDDLTTTLLRDAQLLVSELVTHQLRRLPAGHEGPLRLEVVLRRTGVRVEVTGDHGSASPPIDSEEPAIGWELQVVAQIADRWGIRRDDLTTIWFELES